MCRSLNEEEQDKLLQLLVDMELEIPCDDMGDEWCYEHCKYSCAQKECWIRWAEIKEGT